MQFSRFHSSPSFEVFKPFNRLKKSQIHSGFTLVELLVVIAIIGILATVGLVSFVNSQMRGRDAKRKSDLKQVSNALELFYADHEVYPGSENGLIKACPYVEGGVSQNCTWGQGRFTDTKTVYFEQLPEDPRGQYYYTSPDGKSYELYGVLENKQDPSIKGSYQFDTKDYNFGVTSSNTTLGASVEVVQRQYAAP